MKIYNNAIEMIGNTPMLKINNLDTGCCQLFLKLELANPGGSIKDRIALNMIEKAEEKGLLKPGGTIVEATAGNTGLGLALIAKLKGYRCVIVMPDKMSREKIMHLRAMDAEVIMTRSDVNKGHPDYYQDLAAKLYSEMDNAYFVNQFGNEHNPETHEKYTGPEIWEALDHQVDAFVAGVGSSGTMTGVGHFLSRVNPNIELILADPKGSVLADYINHNKMGQAGAWLVEGIGEDFIPNICDIEQVHKAYTVTDKESFLAARALLQKEGIFAGPSTGTLLHAALTYCQEQSEPKVVVTLACDTGNKYLSKLYNDVWMVDQNFLDAHDQGDLRDVVSYPYEQLVTVTMRPKEPLSTALKRMMVNSISQIPVIDEEDPNKVLGLISEQNLLKALHADSNSIDAPSEAIMSRDYTRLQHTDSFDTLFDALQKNHAILLFAEDKFYGIITHTDAINYLKRTRGKK